MNSSESDPLPRRIRYADRFGFAVNTERSVKPPKWHTIVSSRLGRNLLAHQQAIASIKQFLQLASEREDEICVFAGTAAAPLVDRACQILALPYQTIVEPSPSSTAEVIFDRQQCCQDRASIELCDRVDVIYVRPKGKIMRMLCERLEQSEAHGVHVLVSSEHDNCVQELLRRGAVGYWWPMPLSVPEPCEPIAPLTPSTQDAAQRLLSQPDQWLIHSTRARSGPWPGESRQQFLDGLLLNSLETVLKPQGALETLQRIVHEQRLIGTSQTVRTDQPVVCFSAHPIVYWLGQRSFRAHLGRWDAEPYGIAIRQDFAIDSGVVPVIYTDATAIPGDDDPMQWRYQATGTQIDWTKENEWRAPGVLDLRAASFDQVIIFVKSHHEVTAIKNSPWPVIPIDSFP